MGLINADGFCNYAANYKVVHIDGRYGAGKTILSFRLAKALCDRYGYRYILSNVRSIWNTEPEDVVMRVTEGGVFADAVMVLDEGGIFLDSPKQAKLWLAALRKVNVVLLIPSVLPPSLLMRRMMVQRMFNWAALGVPLWTYDVKIASGMTRAKERFYWWKPSEMYGIYDTVGAPEDADKLLGVLKTWVSDAQKQLGYAPSAKVVSLSQNAIPLPVYNPAASNEDELVEATIETGYMMERVSDDFDDFRKSLPRSRR